MGFLSLFSFFKKQEKKMGMLVLGLDNAGKTTILAQLADEEITSVAPTTGFNVKTVQHAGLTMNVWDIGGQKAIRKYWKRYFKNADCIIFVVDSTDQPRLEEAAVEFSQLLTEPELKGHPILVFANKQDLSGASTAAEVATALDLVTISDRPWQIQGCSAKTGEGIEAGLQWLLKSLDLPTDK
ncbi:putative ADP-ribosylation factor J [Blattamonas nauphoetae]|uniref:ADP-ribosylation factor J n=1 Tax=Blattamonas nauphoetae TaxID=2049346 RepID=A0ABQ9X769_9EUKA|nr:putative ADP-ribosylation factor J [Blattamonas nauphoetae]